jgi:4-alpha-glucanotransferase
VDYATVRALKNRVFRAAFEHFRTHEWDVHGARAHRLRIFMDRARWWLDDYALFRALHAREHGRAWQEWDAPLREHRPEALARGRQELADDILFYSYLQWVASLQWKEACDEADIGIFGDFPFMVSGDSADVWARQHQFRLDVSVGAPPDAFSATGQDWGMPLYEWEVMQREDYRWLRERARRSADLFDGYRVDHLVGFYRTYGKRRDGGEGFFTPPDEPSQLAQGERLMDLFRGAGAEIIAEDLGTVPDFVRASLARMALPGYRVFRWERHWHTDGQPFRDPLEYPAASVATSGTHDTEPLIIWWERAPEEERRKVGDLSLLQRLAGGANIADADYQTSVRDVVLEALYASGSDLLLLPIQDVFGWRDRVNEPATVGENNWTYRLPWAVDSMSAQAEAREVQARVLGWARRHSRH